MILSLPILLTLENMARLKPWLTYYRQRSRQVFQIQSRTMTLLGVDLYLMMIAGTVLSEDEVGPIPG